MVTSLSCHGTPHEYGNIQLWPKQIDFIGYVEDDPDLVTVVRGDLLQALGDRPPSLPYRNRALRDAKSLGNIVSSVLTVSGTVTLTSSQQDFRQWLQSQWNSSQIHTCTSRLFEGHIWSARVLQDQWLVVRGIRLPSSTSNSQNVYNQDAGVATGLEKSSQFSSSSTLVDTARCFMSEPLSAHQMFVRDFDWATTPLGPMSHWNSQLVETVSLALTNTDPACVFWGSGMTSVYNEAFITIAGQKHPAMMGGSPAEAFAEVWDDFFEPRIQLSRKTKEPFSEQGLCLMLERLGYPEETFMTFTFLPLLGPSSEVVGFYHTVTEVTQQILSKRHMSLLLHTSEVLSKAQDLQSFWSLLVDSLTESELDLPFVTLFSVSVATETNSSLKTLDDDNLPSNSCHLEGSLGYPHEHQALRSFSLRSDESLFAPIFQASLKSRDPTLLSLEDKSLPTPLVSGLQQRGHSDYCNTLAVCPLQPTNHETALGFLSIGLSPRRPCDADYRLFISLLVKNISSSLASVVLLEDEKKRGLNIAERAAYESAQLTARLQERELENQIQEHKFMAMAQQVPVGILDLAPDGNVLFCNQAWYEMTRHAKEDGSKSSWVNVIHKDDHALWHKEWTSVSTDLRAVSFETRLKEPWKASVGDDSSAQLDATWVLVRMCPILADDNSLINITASFTDISLQKYTMAKQIQLVEEAVEAKRQQENFVDMTSHEMRNPLHAMLLCAQELRHNLQTITTDDISSASRATLANSVDSADTIIYCGRHQLRIIDDILTLSKLDAKLLQINPIEVQPVAMVGEVLRLFESEVRAQAITLQLQIEESVQELDLDEVVFDPSRVVQILVNFIANAIKFTKTEGIRQIWVTVGASREAPSASKLAAKGIKLIPCGGFYQDPAKLDSWIEGDPIYVYFTVRDTGPGISSGDMLQLFGRFAQTRPKTHAHYGGSGLGLFISQQLAELQGGRVGIASEPGLGSSFYFYIKARDGRCAGAPVTRRDSRSAKKSAGQSVQAVEVLSKKPTQLKAASILIVEDNMVNQKILKRQLEKLGYDISVANHGEEALEVIYQSQIWRGDGAANASGAPLHIVLMDIEMPVMDGRECVQRIREYEKRDLLTLHVPVIALTANARPEQITDAKRRGFDGVITKPFQLSQVVSQISKFLS